MYIRRVKSLLVLSYSIFFLLFSNFSYSQHDDEHAKELKEENHGKAQKKGGFDANEVIFGHVLNAHEYHFLSYTGDDGKDQPEWKCDHPPDCFEKSFHFCSSDSVVLAGG